MGCSNTGYVTADKIAEFLQKLEGFDYESHPLLNDVGIYIVQGAARINASLSATAQCDCTHAAWASTFLEQLNLIAAALMIDERCGVGFNSDERSYWEQWLADQLLLLREGNLDVCDGATGPNYPAYGTATRSVTEWTKAQLIINDILRNL